MPVNVRFQSAVPGRRGALPSVVVGLAVPALTTHDEGPLPDPFRQGPFACVRGVPGVSLRR